jgi:hypothetical protein
VLALAGCSSPRGPSALKDAPGVLAAQRSRPGDLWLTCQPPEAQVEVDGMLRGLCSDFGPTSRGISLGEGMHRIEITHAGHAPHATYVEPRGAKASLNVALRPLQKAEDKP